MKTLLAAGLALALLVACKDVTAGIVVSRDHEPAFTIYQSQCVIYDSKGYCGAWMLMPYTYPESWTLCMRDDTEDRPAKDQDRGCVSVSEDDYNRYQVGEHYP